jgi:glutathione S-transferase
MHLAKKIVDFHGSKKYLIGDDLTYPDFIWFELIHLMEFVTDGAILTTYPSLQVYKDHMKELPNLKEYYANAANVDDIPFNNKMAKINNK